MDAYAASNREAQLTAVVRAVEAAGQRQKDLVKLIEVIGSCVGMRSSQKASGAFGNCCSICCRWLGATFIALHLPLLRYLWVQMGNVPDPSLQFAPYRNPQVPLC